MVKLVKDIPVVKTFMHNNRYFCYDTYSNNLFCVTKDMYLEICKLKKLEYLNIKKSNQQI